MIIGIGNDILQLSRLHTWPLARLRRLSMRILTNKEIILLRSVTGVQSSVFLERSQWQRLDTNNDVPWTAETENLARFLGVRWAAKEAIYKAVCPYHTLRWKDIELMPTRGASSGGGFDSAPPRLSAKLRASFTSPLRLTIDDSTITHLKTHLSISHDGGMIIAMAVVEGA